MGKSTYRRGPFHLDLCFEALEGELAAEDRQCAWEFYTELVTRSAACGRVDGKGEQIFENELFPAEFASLREFLVEARGLMRRYPVGRLKADGPQHLGSLIGGVLQVAVQPFLERWDVRYSAWFQAQRDPARPEFADLPLLIAEWRSLRALCREVVAALEQTYGFRPALLPLVPQHVRDEWERRVPPALEEEPAAISDQ